MKRINPEKQYYIEQGRTYKWNFKSPVSTNSTTPASRLASITVFVGQIQASIIEIDLILMNQKLQLRHGIYWDD